MSYQLDPKNFLFGTAFREGIQQSQDNKRKNALLDLEKQQFGLNERRVGMEEKRYAQSEQERQAAMQAAQRQESIGLRALAAARGDRQSGMAILEELNLPVEFDDEQDWQDFFGGLAEKFGGFEAPPRAPGMPQLTNLGNGVQAIMQDGKIVGSPRFPETDKPKDQWIDSVKQGPYGPIYGQTNSATGEFRVNQATQPAGAGSRPTEGQLTAGGYADRMEKAEANLGDRAPNAKDYFAARKALVGGPIATGFYNAAMSEDAQKYYQAASDWVRAKLRKESGAAIGEQEMEQEIKTYFPTPGDSPDVIKQKKEARKTALEAMKTQAKTPAAQAQGSWSIEIAP